MTSRFSCHLRTVTIVGTQMLFSSGERLLGTQNALLLSALGLVPQIAPWALDFLHLWRAR